MCLSFLRDLKCCRFLDPGAEPAGHKNSGAPVSGSVCHHRGGTHLYPGQSVNSARKKKPGCYSYPDLERNICLILLKYLSVCVVWSPPIELN